MPHRSDANAPPAETPDGVELRPAGHHDLGPVERLLRDADLPVAGVAEHFDDFWVAEVAGELAAAIGLERYGGVGLLRSAVVSPAWRGRGLGTAMMTVILRDAAAHGLSDVYLLTTTAAAWFPRFGFEIIERGRVPVALHDSVEFRGACPASATVMRVSLR